MKHNFNINLIIKSVSTLAAAYTVVSPIFTYQKYNDVAVISTAFIHTPLAVFGAFAAILTLDIDRRFSVIATCFVLLNAGLI